VSEPIVEEGAPPSISRLGRYHVQRVLGSGGMGVVYGAFDPVLGRRLALKVVKSDRTDAQLRARLINEAKNLARVNHVNVCYVVDVGTEDNDVWIAMDLVDGPSLRAWAETHSGAELVAMLVQVAEGLAAVHAAGIIHRDVKPENVLIANGVAKVTDFGLARNDDHVDAVGSTVSGDANATLASNPGYGYATASGVVAGTPAYLAPEQLTGAPLDARVDQFAWAVMAWELITGLRPFPIVASARLEAIRAGITPPPSIPKHVAAVLTRALAAAPRDRFATMREVIDALKIVPRANRTPFIVAGAAIAAIAAGIVIWQVTKSSDAPPPEAKPLPVVLAPAADAQLVVEPDAAVIATPVPVVVDAAVAERKKPPRVDAAVAVVAVDAAVAVVPPPVDDNTPLTADQFPSDKPGIMENMFETMCTVPYDPAAKEFDINNDLDWGRITRRETAISVMGDRRRDLLLYEMKGARRTYRFDGWISHIGALHADVGDLVVICPAGRQDSAWPSPAGWDNTLAPEAFMKVSALPAITKFSKLAPKHVRSGTPSREIQFHKVENPASGHYLLRSKPLHATGTRWEMEGGWFLDVAAAIGAKDIAPTRMWFIVTDGHFDGDKLIYRADAVIAQMFPQ
jgi:predicted Ser/Thr protein kinase